MSKIVPIFLVLVIIALIVAFNMKSETTSPTGPGGLPSGGGSGGSTQVTPEEAAILSNAINSLTDEELAAISADMSDYSTSVDESISQDNSLFIYQ